MKSSSLLLPLAVLLLAVVLSSGASGAPRKVMGPVWEPVNEADPQVVEAGKFAVSEHDRQSKEQLVFVRVVRGETRVAGGIFYRLTLETMDGSRVRNCEAVLWQQEGEMSWELTSFKS